MNRPRDWSQLLRLVRDYSAGAVLSEDERRVALESAMALGCSSVPGTLACSITVATDEEAAGFTTVTSSGALALELDEVQYRLDDGPCLNAARTGQATTIHEMAAERRWPLLAERALTGDVHQSFSVPLHADRAPGALNFYGDRQPAFGAPESRQRAALVARTAALLLSRPLDERQQVSLPLLHQVMAERSLIGQALGIMMARQGMDAETAFHTLAVDSGRQGRRLADIAADIAGTVGDGVSSTNGANTPDPDPEAGHGR